MPLSAADTNSAGLRDNTETTRQEGDVASIESTKGPKKKGNSGHVMMVLEPPGNPFLEELNGKQYRFVEVYVLDSSSVRHFPQESLPPRAGQLRRDGLGKGRIRLVLDEQDLPIGYWEGTYWAEGKKEIRKPSSCDLISFGRMVYTNK